MCFTLEWRTINYSITLYTQTDMQTNGHTTLSQDFDVVPKCLSLMNHTEWTHVNLDFWMKVLWVLRGEGLPLLGAEDLHGAELRVPPLAHVRSLRHRGPPRWIQGEDRRQWICCLRILPGWAVFRTRGLVNYFLRAPQLYSTAAVVGENSLQNLFSN